MTILLSAFLLSVVLVGIHSYFGLEIIKRGIIFTDLAIGQMAAVGAAISIFLLGGEYLYPVSLVFSLLGGLIIALVSRRTENLEAFIGLMYAFGVSAVFILLCNSSHGLETFKKLMAADILFTPMEDILKTAALYAALGVFIFFFHRKTSGFVKDILFFVTFAVTVTSSVKMAGVLIVFALLVAPAMISLRVSHKHNLFLAWTIGTIVNLGAILFSYWLDYPTGYTLVFCHSLLAALATALFQHKKKAEAKA